jgi:hypothetical protein
MKAFTKRIFGAVEPRYLTRAYLISLALLIYAIWYFATQATLQPHQRGIMLAYAALSAILFPFAKLVWDEIRDTIMGNTVLSYDGWAVLVSFVAKIIINVLIWFCAILIAPLGVLYLWFRTRG